jgi:protein-disulfide isomerase
VSAGILTSPVGSDDHVQGAADAPLTLLEYGDYECPHCGRAHPIVQRVQQLLGASLRFAFRNFPLAQAHPHAQHAAVSDDSVSARGCEEEICGMNDLLVVKLDALDDRSLASYAASLGVDPAGVIEDLEAETHAPRVHKDFRGGVRSGVNGTPTFFVNGVRYDGDWSDAEAFAAALRALAAAPHR